MDNVEPGKGRERITDGNNGQHVWCSHIMTGTRANGKKTHGVGLFGMHQGEERRNLCWKIGCSLALTNDGKGYLRGATRLEEDHIQLEQNWRSTAPDKWGVIVSGKWIQKEVWNRMVTTLERDHPHKTPVTSTWTSDFLTREGEGRKTMGDWLRDKAVSW
jgi:hypothetical protein